MRETDVREPRSIYTVLRASLASLATSLPCRASLALLAALLAAPGVSAHPGSGIAVDRDGRVYFVYTGVGVFTADRERKVTRYGEPGFHFMVIDPEGRFEHQRWPRFPDGEIREVGHDPKLLLASSFPVTIGNDGALYYPEAARDGRVHVMRVFPSGNPMTFATLPVAMEAGEDGKPAPAHWIHGLAAGRDGTLYYTEQQAIRRIAPDGSVSLVAEDIAVPDCLRPPAVSDQRLGPAFRGLDVAADGAVYVAASGCSAVLKVTPTGDVSVALRSSDAWSPTGVVVSGDDLYVLEYRQIEAQRAQDWLPRVCRISRDGTVAVIATVNQRSR